MSPEDFKQEKFFIKESPDKIVDKIKEKINQTEFKKWEIEPILELFKKEDINKAVGKLSELIDLTNKEKEHFKSVPIEVILKWFGVIE